MLFVEKLANWTYVGLGVYILPKVYGLATGMIEFTF